MDKAHRHSMQEQAYKSCTLKSESYFSKPAQPIKINLFSHLDFRTTLPRTDIVFQTESSYNDAWLGQP